MKKYIFILGMMLLSISCGNNKDKAERSDVDKYLDSLILEDTTEHKPTIGKYLYIDTSHILHSRLACFELFETHKGVARIPVQSINKIALTRCCPDCIDDETYETLLKIAVTEDTDAEAAAAKHSKSDNKPSGKNTGKKNTGKKKSLGIKWI